MSKIIFQTENAVFAFNQKAVLEHLTPLATDNDIEEAATLLKRIKTATDNIILDPDDHHYFGYAVLDLIAVGKGSVTCNACGKTYKANQLNPIPIGQGKSSFEINLKTRGGIKGSRKKNPSMLGGKGYQCSEGHTLISMETWRT